MNKLQILHSALQIGAFCAMLMHKDTVPQPHGRYAKE